MRDSTKDVVIAFGAVMTMMTVWSFIEAERSKKLMSAKSSSLEKKLDMILAKLGEK